MKARAGIPVSRGRVCVSAVQWRDGPPLGKLTGANYSIIILACFSQSVHFLNGRRLRIRNPIALELFDRRSYFLYTLIFARHLHEFRS